MTIFNEVKQNMFGVHENLSRKMGGLSRDTETNKQKEIQELELKEKFNKIEIHGYLPT